MRDWTRILVALAVLLIGSAAHTANGSAISGNITAQASRPVEAPETVALRSTARGDTSVRIRAAFHEALETYGFTVDSAANQTLSLHWSRAFDPESPRHTVEIYGEGSSRTAPSLGLNLMLPLRNARQGDRVYTMGCRLTDSRGEVWKAKAVAVTTSTDRARIARVLARQLVHHIGQDVSNASFRSVPAR